ncbi:hypothetical protein [Streptomyces sp. NPDC057580]|uniref:hypothetical protein n=1 Tax=Streptomyces sp. NPDC057580 TaxID=3346173 RepID=UPI0036A0DA96
MPGHACACGHTIFPYHPEREIRQMFAASHRVDRATESLVTLARAGASEITAHSAADPAHPHDPGRPSDGLEQVRHRTERCRTCRI